jgi:hypothetical protein
MTSNDSLAHTREVMERTSRAAVTAHEADVQAAMDGVEWERRGFLRALTRRRRESPPRNAREVRSMRPVSAGR